jgi:hypothetical protein
MQLNLYISLAIFLSLPPSGVTQMSNCQNTSQTICNGTFPLDNGFHPQYECTANLSSSFELSSCITEDPSIAIYWYWYDDICRYNSTRGLPFAIVASDGKPPCMNSLMANITYESCQNDYNFTGEIMTIKNITEPTPQKYICFLSNNPANMNYTSTRIYVINILSTL